MNNITARLTRVLTESQTNSALNNDFEDIHIHNHIGTLPRFIHKNILKPISYFLSSRILRNQLIKAVGDIKGKSVMDVSAGDDRLILKLAKTADLAIANDISSIEMTPLLNKKSNYPNLKFSINNFIDLKGPKTDIVICKNTIHHMNTVKQVKKAFLALKRLSKNKIIIMDIEDPRKYWLSRLWNDYYRYLLKDQGGFFVTYEQFLRALQVVFEGCDFKTKRIKTIKGFYMLAEITK